MTCWGHGWSVAGSLEELNRVHCAFFPPSPVTTPSLLPFQGYVSGVGVLVPPLFFCRGDWESSPNVMEPVSSNPQNKNPSQMYEVGSCSYELKDGKMFVIQKQSADIRCDYITICCITSFIHPHPTFFFSLEHLNPLVGLNYFQVYD